MASLLRSRYGIKIPIVKTQNPGKVVASKTISGINFATDTPSDKANQANLFANLMIYDALRPAGIEWMTNQLEVNQANYVKET